MRYLAFLLFLTFLPVSAADENPEPVKVYCFSADLEAGFKDRFAKTYCVQLGKRGEKKGSLALVDQRESADIIIEHLGVEEISERGEATFLNYGIAWTPELSKNKAAAILKAGDFAKVFSADGINAQATDGLIKKTEKWIRENREVILQKAREK